MPIWSPAFFGSGAGSSGYVVEDSCWFNGTSDRLTFDPSGASGTPDLYCLSYWAKRSTVGGSDTNVISGGVSGYDSTIRYTNYSSYTDAIQFYANGGPDNLITNAAFSDPTAWHHVFARYDSNASGGSSDYMELWVNGVRLTSFASSSMPSAGENSTLFDGNIIAVGGYNLSATQWFDGYLAEVAASDGQDHAATDFGEYDDNGVWIPKDPSGLSYGTNGFLLQFKQTGSGQDASGIGADTSGNDNHFAIAGGSPQNNQVPDTCTDDANNNIGNYATLSPLDFFNASATLSEGNLKAVGTGTTTAHYNLATINFSSGKYIYASIPQTSNTAWDGHLNLHNVDFTSATRSPGTGIPDNTWTMYMATAPAMTFYNGAGGQFQVNTSPTWALGDYLLHAVDADNNKLWFGWYDVSAGNTYWLNYNSGSPTSSTWDADPASGSGAITLDSPPYAPSLAVYSSPRSGVFDAGQGGYINTGVTIPSGFKFLNTANLPAPTVADPSKYFATVTYTGDTNNNRNITGFQDAAGNNITPDWVWIKGRSNATSHYLQDVARAFGGSKELLTDSTSAEGSQGTGNGYIGGVVAGGFTAVDGGTNDVYVNENSRTYVAWMWKAGGAASTTSPAGTVASSTSVADHGGFSIGTFTVNTTGAFTVGHGLSRVPAMIIVKDMDAAGGWWVWVETYAATGTYLRLETVDPTSTSGTFLNATPTDEVFSTSGWLTNTHEHVFYAFAKTPGAIASGTFVGANAADGSYIVVDDGASGFRPAWFMFKNISSNGDWYIFDSGRNTYNPANSLLAANQAHNESTMASNSTNGTVDFTANGVKFRSTNGSDFQGAKTFIYLAFAENPFGGDGVAQARAR